MKATIFTFFMFITFDNVWRFVGCNYKHKKVSSGREKVNHVLFFYQIYPWTVVWDFLKHYSVSKAEETWYQQGCR